MVQTNASNAMTDICRIVVNRFQILYIKFRLYIQIVCVCVCAASSNPHKMWFCVYSPLIIALSEQWARPFNLNTSSVAVKLKIRKVRERTPEVLSVNWNKIARLSCGAIKMQSICWSSLYQLNTSLHHSLKKFFWSDFRIFEGFFFCVSDFHLFAPAVIDT